MRRLKTATILYLLIAFIVSNQNIQAENGFKKVVRFGLEYHDFLSANTGSFSKSPGFTVGYLTGINVYGFPQSDILVGLDINFTKTFVYRNNINYLDTDIYWLDYYKYRYVYDEKFTLSFIQIGLHPAYYYSLSEKTVVGVYFGGSVGFGTEVLYSNLVTRTIIDSTNHYDHTLYGINGEYNKDSFRFPIGYDFGISVYYGKLMIDLRYTYIDINYKNSLINNSRNVYLQMGLVL